MNQYNDVNPAYGLFLDPIPKREPPPPTPDTTEGPQLKVVGNYTFMWNPGDPNDPLNPPGWVLIGPARATPVGAEGGGTGRNDALDAAQAALSSFLQAQSLADARKAAAIETFMNLAKYAVPPGTQYAPGYEPGGLAHQLAASLGLEEYHVPPMQTRTISPEVLMQPGQIPPEVMQMIGDVRRAGGLG
jgi:hypothetical protein